MLDSRSDLFWIKNTWSWVWVPSRPVCMCKYVDQTAWLPCCPSGVTGEMNLRNHPNKGSILAFETQGRRHQKSKIEVSVASQKGPMPSKNARIIVWGEGHFPESRKQFVLTFPKTQFHYSITTYLQEAQRTKSPVPPLRCNAGELNLLK